MAATIDPAALRTLLALAELGARAEGATFTPRTMETWQLLAMSATGRGPAIIHIGESSPSVGAGEWMTVPAAARAMGVSERHARRLARGGAVLAARHGKVWMIDRQAAEDWRRAA